MMNIMAIDGERISEDIGQQATVTVRLEQRIG